MQILGHRDDHPRGHWLTGTIWSVLIGAAAVPLAVYLFVPWVLLELGIESLTVGRPGTVMLLFASTSTVTGYTFSVGSGSLLLGAGLGILYGFFRRW